MYDPYLFALQKGSKMKKIKEKEPVDPDKVSSDNERLTRRQAIKRIAMGAGMGIAAVVFGAKGADASKHCCIEAYPDYNYRDDGYNNYYNNTYNNYSYSNYDNYRNHYVVYSAPGPGYINYSDGHDR